MARIPDGLIAGGPATSRPVSLAAPFEAVLRPKLGWRLVLGFFAFTIPFSAASQIASGTWQWPSLFFAVPMLLTATAAWRKKVVLDGDRLTQQGTLTRYPELRAAEIVAVTAHREKRDILWDGTPAVVLRLWEGDGTRRGYGRFWWGHWEVLARWVAFHQTKSSPDGVPHWTIPTDGETMRRLAPLLERTSGLSSGGHR